MVLISVMRKGGSLRPCAAPAGPAACLPTSLAAATSGKPAPTPAAVYFSQWRHCMDLRKAWGHAAVLFQRTRLLHWIDLLLVVGLAGLVVGAVHLAGEWCHELRPTVDIDLDNPWALLQYTFLSLSRGLIAFVLSV